MKYLGFCKRQWIIASYDMVHHVRDNDPILWIKEICFHKWGIKAGVQFSSLRRTVSIITYET
jgi:hypothetical protein